MVNGQDVAEREYLEELLSTRGWSVYFRNILTRHRQHLIDKCHTSLGKGEFQEAKEYLARAKEPTFIIDIVKNRLKELKQKENE